MKPQVASEHYHRLGYDTRERWVSYAYQVWEVLRAEPERCLEVGLGNGTVRDLIRARGVEVVTVDLDPALGPDLVGDARALPCADREFDVVLCAEVLEHLPLEEVPNALRELRRVARRRVVVSIPQTGRYCELAFRVPPWGKVGLMGRLPSWRRWRFDGQHYWEAGARGARLRDIRRMFRVEFRIVREYLLPENAYHRFYVLEPL